ncbi:DNA polymerase/3'-5' exonuclease PolX [uncultured Mucilaginibacter sp.]|uniref:DNA polymerase/3'-5' exonuclease PolX n=1 Tax=uncultured Mucilaginibacter sp. TaxID=797541 RepID=UPI00260CCD1B|nr:DNA polymerase/3'-5' exonuclease PolX [uncultured Mucilaginibacter sp.]
MENKLISRHLRFLSQLMELHGENPFKIKSIANASFKVDKLPFPLNGKSIAELDKIDGIGKSIAEKIVELFETGSLKETEHYLSITPEGVVEMMQIKGIGPKKVAVIWHDLHIDTVGELYYACNENRLIEAKGFGLKTQEQIRKTIEFNLAAQGKFLYAQAEGVVYELTKIFNASFTGIKLAVAGEFRRSMEIINELVFVVAAKDEKAIFAGLNQLPTLTFSEQNGQSWLGQTEHGLDIKIICCKPEAFTINLFKATGNDEHVEAVLARIEYPDFQPKSEEEIYQKAGLNFIEQELREGITWIKKASAGELPELITFKDLKGTLHNHSTWSDGVNTLEEMALYSRDQLKLEYFGICDHSKSAFYASGLSIERVLQQFEEVDSLNKKLQNFQIFKGIESDILNDGSLDYPDEILKRFDFVVASVHSNLRMTEEKAMERLIKAIENPYTTILGHPTGRLLLSRNGYPVDYKKMIDACAANGVVIEINANPLRLDLDWRWHQYALEKGVWLSINPDAHRTTGLWDMHYGIHIARKGGLTKEQCLNALSAVEIAQFFESKKERILHDKRSIVL